MENLYRCKMNSLNAVFLAESEIDVREFVRGKGVEPADINLCLTEVGDVCYDVSEFKAQALELQACLANATRREEVSTRVLRMTQAYSPAMAGLGLGGHRVKVAEMQDSNPAFCNALKKLQKAHRNEVIGAACKVSELVRIAIGI